MSKIFRQYSDTRPQEYEIAPFQHADAAMGSAFEDSQRFDRRPPLLIPFKESEWALLEEARAQIAQLDAAEGSEVDWLVELPEGHVDSGHLELLCEPLIADLSAKLYNPSLELPPLAAAIPVILELAEPYAPAFVRILESRLEHISVEGCARCLSALTEVLRENDALQYLQLHPLADDVLRRFRALKLLSASERTKHLEEDDRPQRSRPRPSFDQPWPPEVF